MKRFFWLAMIVLFCSCLACGQNYSCDDQVKYENHNQLYTKTILLAQAKGRVIEEDGNPAPTACIALFTEKTHRFIAQVPTGKNGYFIFRGIPQGRYRLVAKDLIYCLANVPIRIVKNKPPSIHGNRLVFHMIAYGIDRCSYADTK